MNEEANIARCLEALLARTADYDTEIIIADSLSSDRSVDIARRFPVRVVQLMQDTDRRCGAAGHLGWQFARGEFLLLIDGDMELRPEFLPAAFAQLHADPRLAAVGGQLEEMSDGLEFRERQLRPDPNREPGLVKHISGCALYRTSALEDVGHFMDRNLHCFEEFELGLRLRTRGWRLRMLDVPCVRHYGHLDPPLRLLVRRWRTRFLLGYGELLRSAWGRPWFLEATKPCRLPLLVIGWWASLAALGVAAAFVPGLLLPIVAVAFLPFALLLARKMSLRRAGYSWLMLQLSAAALIAGLVAPRVGPTVPLRAVVLQDPANAGGPSRGGAAPQEAERRPSGRDRPVVPPAPRHSIASLE